MFGSIWQLCDATSETSETHAFFLFENAVYQKTPIFIFPQRSLGIATFCQKNSAKFNLTKCHKLNNCGIIRIIICVFKTFV